MFFPSLCSGVWATQLIPKGKRFGPFVGEKKKRSQVTSNVYMWEVGCKSEHTFLQACATYCIVNVPKACVIISANLILIVLEIKKTHVTLLQCRTLLIILQLHTDQR